MCIGLQMELVEQTAGKVDSNSRGQLRSWHLCFGLCFPRIGQCSKMLVLSLPFLPLPNIPERLHLTLTPEGQIFIFNSFKVKQKIVISKHRARNNFKESLLSYKPAFPVITEWEMGGVYFGRIVICACLPFKLYCI